jgi:hypothetical protein
MPKGRSAFDATFKVLSHDFVLVTNLSTPPLRPNLVLHLHLLERLDQGLTCSKLCHRCVADNSATARWNEPTVDPFVKGSGR